MDDYFHVQHLSVFYGEAIALNDVSIQVNKGQIVTIIGANGAGKTTLVNTIAGILPARSGAILLQGQDLTTVAPHHVCNYSVAIVPEGRRLFTKLTVLDNLKMGAYPRHARASESATLDYVFSILPRLAERRRQIAGTLSGGEQQMVAIARALMAKPKLLLLDEPSLGLAPTIIEDIFSMIEQINRESGVTILLVEQNANKALGVADYAYVLSDGSIVQEGASDVLIGDANIRRTYLGIGVGAEHDKNYG